MHVKPQCSWFRVVCEWPLAVSLVIHVISQVCALSLFCPCIRLEAACLGDELDQPS